MLCLALDLPFFSINGKSEMEFLYSFCGILLFSFFLSTPSFAKPLDVKKIKSGVVKISSQAEGQSKIGTGVILFLDNERAFIGTAAHVIEGDPSPKISFYSNPFETYNGKTIGMNGADPNGLALLVVKGDLPKGLSSIQLTRPSSIQPSEVINIVGFPRMIGLSWAFTHGVFSGQKGPDIIVSGDLDEGNSGGPVLDREGILIGLVTQTMRSFGFVVPTAIARISFEGWGLPDVRNVFLPSERVHLSQRVISSSSEQTSVELTPSQVKQKWREHLYKYCSETILPSYPFSANGDDISFDALASFFHPITGELWNFYDRELKPFIDEKPHGWVLKAKGSQGKKLPLSNQALESLQYAGAFSNALFPQNKFNVEFDLLPFPEQGTSAMYVSAIDFWLADQLLRYQMGPQVWASMMWSDLQGRKDAAIQMKYLDEWETLKEEGDFGLLHLLDRSIITNNEDGSLTAEWKIPSRTAVPLRAKYLFRPRNELHPFSRTFWEKFSCIPELW